MLHKGPKNGQRRANDSAEVDTIAQEGQPALWIDRIICAWFGMLLAGARRVTLIELNVPFFIKGDNPISQVFLMSFPRKDTGDLYFVVKKFQAYNDKEVRDRFNSQAPTIFELHHEHIARTYAIVELEDYIRILMEPMDFCLERLRARVSFLFIGCN